MSQPRIHRELHHRPAGLRTHMLVSLASALFTILTFEIAGTRLLVLVVAAVGAAVSARKLASAAACTPVRQLTASSELSGSSVGSTDERRGAAAHQSSAIAARKGFPASGRKDGA